MSAESAAALRDGLELAHWSITDLWIAAVGVGGGFGRAEIEHIADGTTHATAVQHDILAAALNDHFTAQGQDHPVSYWRDLVPPLDAGSP
jgi:hypothetical protein